jgi:hypothetical protein
MIEEIHEDTQSFTTPSRKYDFDEENKLNFATSCTRLEAPEQLELSISVLSSPGR